MDAIVGMHEAKTNFSKLVKLVEEGGEVVVTNAGKPVARIVAYERPAAPRKPGLLKSKLKLKKGFDEVSPELREAFE